MTARVLVVDDLEPNVKLLEAKLRAEYYDVVTALSGLDAIEAAKKDQPDIILLDIMMPGIDGFETCRRLKSDKLTCHIPVVMVTALDQQADRIAGLEAGADDFLTKPVEDVALFARVRSLTRLKMMTDELRLSHNAGQELGVLTAARLAEFDALESTILVIDDAGEVGEELKDALPDHYRMTFESDAKEAVELLRRDRSDLIIMNMSLDNHDPLRLCSTIRSIPETRLIPLLAMVRKGDMRVLVKSLDVGVNDYVTRPVDGDELAARVRTQLRRKHYIDQLRSSFQTGLELAVTDELTGLYNRRYLAMHMETLFEELKPTGKPVSVLMIDVDHFKPVNDTYGHETGDEVLRAISKRLVYSVRGIDVACRYGGEEFVFLMPETDGETAAAIAERLRREIEEHPVPLTIDPDIALSVTVSVGIATSEETDTPQSLLARADEALYRAKENGRNRVIASAA